MQIMCAMLLSDLYRSAHPLFWAWLRVDLAAIVNRLRLRFGCFCSPCRVDLPGSYSAGWSTFTARESSTWM